IHPQRARGRAVRRRSRRSGAPPSARPKEHPLPCLSFRTIEQEKQITSISACADALYVLPLEVGAQRSERRALTMQVGRGGWHGISGSSEVRAGCTDRREPRGVERAQHGGESSILDRDCRLENGRRVQAASGPAADTQDAVL